VCNIRPEEIFGTIIRDVRNQKSISQEELSRKTGLDRSFLSQIETGKKSPSLSTILKLSKAFDINISDLMKKFETLYVKMISEEEDNNVD